MYSFLAKINNKTEIMAFQIGSNPVPQTETVQDTTLTMDEINAQNSSSDGIPSPAPSVPEEQTVQNGEYDQNVAESAQMDYGGSKQVAGLSDLYGTPSLFNKYAIFVHPKADQNNGFQKLKDIRGRDKIYSTNVPETPEIVDSLKNDPIRRLHYADFAFSRWHRFIPNNRAIVLRRFPFPTYNNLSFVFKKGDSPRENQKIKPLAKAVTYFGEETGNEIAEIIKISGYKNYKELTADLDMVKGVDKGLDDSPFAGVSRAANKGLKVFSALSGRGDLDGSKANSVDVMLGKNWENDRRGPENVIHKTMIADVGVGATLAFALTFEYKLRGYNNINPRVALLDLITNLMTLVHTNAEFWGGQNIVLPNHQQFPFIGDQDSFYSGDYGKYLGSVVDWFSAPFKSGGSFQGLIDGIMSGDFSSLGSFLQGVGSKALDIQSAKSRSSVIGLKTLLSGTPIGNYHITIGNPLDPWFQLGNLVVKTWELSFENEMGIHNMPTGVKLVVNLETATPMDSTGVQGALSIGNRTNRVYFKPADFLRVATDVKNGDTNYTADDIDRAHGSVY